MWNLSYILRIVQGGCTNDGLSMPWISKTQVEVWGVGVNTVETRARNKPSTFAKLSQSQRRPLQVPSLLTKLYVIYDLCVGFPIWCLFTVGCGLTPVQHSVLIDSWAWKFLYALPTRRSPRQVPSPWLWKLVWTFVSSSIGDMTRIVIVVLYRHKKVEMSSASCRKCDWAGRVTRSVTSSRNTSHHHPRTQAQPGGSGGHH